MNKCIKVKKSEDRLTAENSIGREKIAFIWSILEWIFFFFGEKIRGQFKEL